MSLVILSRKDIQDLVPKDILFKSRANNRPSTYEDDEESWTLISHLLAFLYSLKWLKAKMF